jgi:dimethylargininase
MTPTLPSRRKETLAVEEVLRAFRRLERLPEGAQLEGGDVLVVGRTLYVGLSGRTNEKGARALEKIVVPFGYEVVPVRVSGCLHLKTGCCALAEDTLLVNRQWIEVSVLTEFRLVEVPVEEPWGANVLVLPNVVVVGSAFPTTVERVQRMGHSVVALDLSELQKAEAGLTCLSLLFDGAIGTL